MVIFSALVRSHQSTSTDSFGPVNTRAGDARPGDSGIIDISRVDMVRAVLCTMVGCGVRALEAALAAGGRGRPARPEGEAAIVGSRCKVLN